MSKKLTTKEFISSAIKIHGNKYDYSKVKYNGSKSKVDINCKEHGEFSQKPNNHISLKQGCPKCKSEILSSLNSKSEVDFIRQAKLIHNNIYGYERVVYNKSTDKITIKCSKHGYFEQESNSHLQGHGCPVCGIEKNTKLPKYLRPFMKRVKGVIQQSYFRKGFTKKSRTYKLLGCDWGIFKTHLEDNPYGFTINCPDLDLDHIVPTSSAKSEEELVILSHYTNFQLLPSIYNQNIKRNNKFNKSHFEKWLQNSKTNEVAK